MNFLLDTNVVSELRKAGDGKANANVVAWLLNKDAQNFYVSAVTLMEIEIGVLRLERRDLKQGMALRAWLEAHVLPEFSARTLPVDLRVARRCAKLHVPNPSSWRDSIIAATALVHGMTVVTRNVTDFMATGVNIVNPWEEH